MTEDQIKAVVEEYVKHKTTQKYVWRFHPETDLKIAIQSEALQLLKYLSTHYCIVEREKVIEEFDKTRVLYEGRSDVSIYMQNALYRIFGTSMFKQNEE